MILSKKLTVNTTMRSEVIDITNKLQAVVSGAKISEGVLVASSKHSSCSLALANKTRTYEVLTVLKRIFDDESMTFPNREIGMMRAVAMNFLLNPLCIPITEGNLDLGEWQAVFLIEFVGPRAREISVKVISED
jgi:secondary thiamine-phosphate synthase enzyme